MKIGFLELLVIFVVALLVIGPDKLPAYARKLGNALREFRKASADITQDIRESVVDPLEDAQRPLREAMEPLEKLDRDVRADLKGVETDLKNIGKEKPKQKQDMKPETGNAAEPNAELPADTAPPEKPEPEPETEDLSADAEAKETGGTL